MDDIVEAHIRPLKEVLFSILRDLLGPRADPRTLQCCALSVMGQCLHHAYARPIIERLQLSLGADARTLEALARHITEFSLGGIARVRAGATVWSAAADLAGPTGPAGATEDASRGRGGSS
jgi:hypothetical protein